MANPQHLALLEEGISAWNEWRKTQEGFQARPDFSEADLEDAHLEKGRFLDGDFRGANLTMADAEHANLAAADFRDATLSCTDLSGANLSGADFTNAHISGAIFEGADLRNAKGLVFDGNDIRGARISPNAKDPWSVLRHAYTGPKMAFVLILSMLFFLPIAARTAFWVSLSRGQQAIGRDVHLRLDQLASTVEDRYGAEAASSVRDFANRLESESQVRGRRYSVGQLLIGWDLGWTNTLLAITLIVYNVLRLILTATVAPMREEEERSGHAPDWGGNKIGVNNYGWLRFPHRVVKMLMWLSISLFAIHLVQWCSMPVWLP